jgi:hypothetical protein
LISLKVCHGKCTMLTTKLGSPSKYFLFQKLTCWTIIRTMSLPLFHVMNMWWHGCNTSYSHNCFSGPCLWMDEGEQLVTNWMNEIYSSKVLPINSNFQLQLKPIMTISTCTLKTQKLVNISYIIINYSQMVQAYQKITKVWQNESIILLVIISLWFNLFFKMCANSFLNTSISQGLLCCSKQCYSSLHLIIYLFLCKW